MCLLRVRRTDQPDPHRRAQICSVRWPTPRANHGPVLSPWIVQIAGSCTARLNELRTAIGEADLSVATGRKRVGEERQEVEDLLRELRPHGKRMRLAVGSHQKAKTETRVDEHKRAIADYQEEYDTVLEVANCLTSSVRDRAHQGRS